MPDNEFSTYNIMFIGKFFSLILFTLQVKSTDFPGSYPGYEDAWDFKKFQKVNNSLKIVLILYCLHIHI